jgi:hypothetical protein
MKNRSDKPNDDKREELRQQLWELAYGLLEPNEASTLIARVKSDPAVARLYAEVKLQIDLVSKASRVEDSSLTLTVAGKVGPAGAKDKRPAAGKARGSKTGQAGPVAKKTGSGWGDELAGSCRYDGAVGAAELWAVASGTGDPGRRSRRILLHPHHRLGDDDGGGHAAGERRIQEHSRPRPGR